jgi:hypothetical protein
MLIREISKQNLIEIIAFPLIFIMLFILGIYLFVYLELLDYVLYTSWCLISGVIVVAIIFYFTYMKIKPIRREPIYHSPRYPPDWPPNRAPIKKRKKVNPQYDIEILEE